MGQVTAARGSVRGLFAGLLAALEAVLCIHAHVLFSRSRLVGALLVLAAATAPVGLAHGLVGLAAAVVTVRVLGLAPGVLRDGPYGYNALFIGLSVAHAVAPGPLSVGLAAAAASVGVLLTAALSSLLARAALPVLTLPFVLVSWTLLGVTPLLGAEPAVHALASTPVTPEPLSGVLSSLGALFFAPGELAGALVLTALVVHSRIATTLAAMAIGVGLAGARSIGVVGPSLQTPLVLNAVLTAVAVGGVWFVPSAGSYALAASGAALSATLLVGLSGPLDRLGLPALILPFSVTLGLVLLATRQRARDEAPKAVDFTPGSPEENLAYHQSRVARFESLREDSLRLPFRGVWTCTQGQDGAHTHQGAWRHGLDFEVEGPDGRVFQGEGASVEDHHCFRLPVLAVADGVVARVESDVADNIVGGLELRRNWGNVVVLYHSPGVYSLVAHLAKGSAKVREGQPVKRGDTLGLCGSSGRSPRPHLHFQLQATAELGAPTLPCRFTDVVVDAGAESPDARLARSLVPTERQHLRNLAPDAELAACFALEPGGVLVLSTGAQVEHLEHEVDLLGGLVLRSRELGARLHFSRSGEGFTALEVTGSPRSALHVLRAALARVPFDADPKLGWTDYLPSRWAGLPLARLLRDFVAPFAPSPGLEMTYRVQRERGLVVVLGESRAHLRSGQAEVRTRATLSPTHGVLGLELESRGRHISVRRVVDAQATPGSERAAPTPGPATVAPTAPYLPFIPDSPLARNLPLAPVDPTARATSTHHDPRIRHEGDTP